MRIHQEMGLPFEFFFDCVKTGREFTPLFRLPSIPFELHRTCKGKLEYVSHLPTELKRLLESKRPLKENQQPNPQQSGQKRADSEDTVTSSLSDTPMSTALELRSAPPGPDREPGVVTQLEHFIALLHFHRDDGRLATERDLGTFHFNLVFCLDLHVLVL